MRTAPLLILVVLIVACGDPDSDAGHDADSASRSTSTPPDPFPGPDPEPHEEPPVGGAEGADPAPPPETSDSSADSSTDASADGSAGHDEALVEAVAGEVTRRDGKNTDLGAVTQGQRLQQGDQILLAEDAALVLTLSRGGRIEVAGPAAFSFELLAPYARTVRLHDGTIRVHTEKVLCGVMIDRNHIVGHGTYEASCKEKEATFGAISGEVKAAIDGKVHSLAPGESRTVPRRSD